MQSILMTCLSYIYCDKLRLGTQNGSILLFYLDGTIPMIYMGTKYNCPIQIWFTYDYPQQPPTCVVVPIPSMRIQPGHLHVGPNGLVYHPYLSEWNESSSLEKMCEELSIVFGKIPPVYSVPSGPATQPQRASPVPPAPAVTARDDDSQLQRAIEESQKEEIRRRQEIERERDEELRVIGESKAANEERRRLEQRKKEEGDALQDALHLSKALEASRRQELIDSVSSKLEVSKPGHIAASACAFITAAPEPALFGSSLEVFLAFPGEAGARSADSGGEG